MHIYPNLFGLTEADIHGLVSICLKWNFHYPEELIRTSMVLCPKKVKAPLYFMAQTAFPLPQVRL